MFVPTPSATSSTQGTGRHSPKVEEKTTTQEWKALALWAAGAAAKNRLCVFRQFHMSPSRQPALAPRPSGESGPAPRGLIGICFFRFVGALPDGWGLSSGSGAGFGPKTSPCHLCLPGGRETKMVSGSGNEEEGANAVRKAGAPPVEDALAR